MGKGSLKFVPLFRLHRQNPTSKRRFSSVSLVTIPAFTTIVDRPFKEDRTLCPVRALRYYLDQTKDLTGSRSLLFISFKKGHTSDFRPCYSLFLVKQTILLCYITNKQTNIPWTWSKLKHMTLGPLWPLRPFTVGFQWTKSYKLVTGKLTTHFQICYLKDLTCLYNDNNMYLGPAVAARQVLNLSPHQTIFPRKERGGGGGGAHPLQPNLQESKSQGLGICLPPQDVW